MNNITDGILEDVEGAAHTVVNNGAKIIQDPQLGYALSLDGKDDWVDTGKYEQLTCGMGDVISNMQPRMRTIPRQPSASCKQHFVSLHLLDQIPTTQVKSLFLRRDLSPQFLTISLLSK